MGNLRESRQILFQPGAVDDSAARSAQQLARTLNDFSRSARSIGAVFQKKENVRQREQGIEEGLASVSRDEAGNLQAPVQRELGFFGNAGDRAFNRAAQVGFQAAAVNDLNDKVADLEVEFADDAEGFNNAWNAYVGGATKDLNATQAFSLNNKATRLGDRANNRIDARVKEEIRVEASIELSTLIGDTTQDILKDERAGIDTTQLREELEGMTDNGVASKLLDPSKVEQGRLALADQTILEQSIGQVTRVIDDPNVDEMVRVQKGYDLIETIRSSDIDLDPGTKDKLISSLEKIVDSRAADLQVGRSETEIANGKVITDLIYDAEFSTDRGADEIWTETERLHTIAAISDSTRLRIKRLLRSKEIKRIVKANRYGDIAKRLAGDDSVVIEKKQLDNYYNEVYAPGLSDDPDIRFQEQMQFVDLTRQIPKGLLNEVQSNIRSQNLDLVAEAVSIVDGINQIPGMPDNWLPASEQAYADIFIGLSANLSPEEAAKEANRRTDPVNRGRIEAIQGEIKATVKKKPNFYLDTVVGHFDGATSIDLGVLENEYQDLYVNYREGGYDDPAAEKKALEVLDRNWSLSEVGGNRMMRHAPEQFYKTVSPGAIRDDFVKQVQLASEATGLFQVNDKTLYELFSDRKTNTGAREGKPTYRMRIITDGIPFVLTGFRYVVPVQELENNERIKNKQINDEVIEDAKRTLLIKQKVQRGRF